ncbi:MAG: hypothetical protein KAJ62_03835 [Desulfobacteraceae bacterium]|nr:hypothetical protein [Desulfobacteraceae bacterium]
MGKQKTFLCINTLMIIGILLIFSTIVHGKSQPFKSYEEASKKLNTPKLIDEYQKKYFKWASTRRGGGCGDKWNIGVNLDGCPKSFIFDNKGKGNCGAHTTFAVDCLRKAGYEAYPLYIYQSWGGWSPKVKPRDYHIVTLYKENGKWYIMNNGANPKRGGQQKIKGPFDAIKDLPYKVIKVDREFK